MRRRNSDPQISCTDGILQTGIGEDYRKKCKRNIYIFRDIAKNDHGSCMKFLICHTLRVNDKSERKKKNAKGKRFY